MNKLTLQQFNEIAIKNNIIDADKIYILYISILNYPDFLTCCYNYYIFNNIITKNNSNKMTDFEIDFEYFGNQIFDIDYLFENK